MCRLQEMIAVDVRKLWFWTHMPQAEFNPIVRMCEGKYPEVGNAAA